MKRRDITKLDDVQRHAIFSVIRLLIALIGAIASSIIGWVFLDTSAPHLHALAWVVGGIFIGTTFLLFVIYLIAVFKG